MTCNLLHDQLSVAIRNRQSFLLLDHHALQDIIKIPDEVSHDLRPARPARSAKPSYDSRNPRTMHVIQPKRALSELLTPEVTHAS